MNMTKRILAVLLTGAMLLGLTACGGGGEKIGNSTTDIEISYWNSGLDEDWLKNMVAAFEAKYPEYNVEYTATASDTAASSSFGLEDVDTVDLYLTVKLFDHSEMEPLNDILDAVAPGDTKPLKEKFNQLYLELEKARDGNYYGLTYGGGVLSLVYNKQMFADVGITQLPRTTDELAAVCDRLARANKVPLAHYQDGGYWSFIGELWFAQADGLDYYLNNFYACTDEKGVSPSIDVMLADDGRHKVLKAYEKLITPDYVMAGSNSNDHVTVQTQFLNGGAAMMVNGSWLSNEMESVGTVDNFGMMRMPVISSITDRLETVKTDSALRRVISAIDSIADGEKTEADYKSGDNYVVDGTTVSAADWEILVEARRSVATNFAGEVGYIPTYSNAKDGAKKFLQFIYSDEGYKIYTDTLNMVLPLSFCDAAVDTSTWNSYEATQYQLLKEATAHISRYNSGQHAIFTDGGASTFPVSYSFLPKMCSKNSDDRKSADEVWADVMAFTKDNFENTWLANIK